MKKIISLILALVMVMGLVVVASAAETTGSITITPPAGTQNATYKIYKVFDAVGDGTNIRYTVMSSKSGVPTGFSVDTAGNVSYSGTGDGSELTEADINAIKAYVDGDTAVATANVTGGAAVTVSGLANGYYYIATNSGAVVAINSTNPNAEVTDKNDVPTLEKKIIDADGALVDSVVVEAGSTVTFQIKVYAPLVGDMIIHDQLTKGFKCDTSAITLPDGVELLSSYTCNDTNCQSLLGTKFHIKITDEAERSDDGYVTITYTALVDATNGLQGTSAKNTAFLTADGYRTVNDVVNAYNYEVNVYKYYTEDGAKKPLEGAGFVLAKTENGQTKYYTVTTVNGIRDVTWVDNIDDAVRTSPVTGEVWFPGLANGTYTLIEHVVPAGYNKAPDRTITVDGANLGEAYNGYAEDTGWVEVENVSGSTLPSTGGIGTTLFYVIGGLMMACAAVILITKRRVA